MLYRPVALTCCLWEEDGEVWSGRAVRLFAAVCQCHSQCLMHGGLRRGAGRGASHRDKLERRQRAAVERSDESGAAGVGDLG